MWEDEKLGGSCTDLGFGKIWYSTHRWKSNLMSSRELTCGRYGRKNEDKLMPMMKSK